MSISTAVKRRCGIFTDAFDEDIASMERQARLDLKDSGVNSTLADGNDPRVTEAVITFILARSAWMDEASAARYEKSYILQAQKLSAVGG